MWFRKTIKNRRLGRKENVLDVKLRSSQVRAARLRVVSVGLGVSFGTVLGIYLLWQAGDWLLDKLVYENKTFAIRNVDIQTDGVVSQDQLRRWSGVQPGRNLLALDLSRVKRDLELVPVIQSASIERILPATLRIRVTERLPVAQIDVPRPRAGGGIEVVIFQLDADGYVLVPLDPRQRAVPLSQADDQLPLISGINASELQAGRRINSPQVQAALRLIEAFESSPMAGRVELKRIDTSSPEVLVVTTAQGGEVTLGLQDLSWQLARWRKVYDECQRLSKTIGTLDLAVTDSTPLRLVEATAVPPPLPSKAAKPQRNKKKNV